VVYRRSAGAYVVSFAGCEGDVTGHLTVSVNIGHMWTRTTGTGQLPASGIVLVA